VKAIRRFGGAYQRESMRKAEFDFEDGGDIFSETSADFQGPTRRYIPEDNYT
jgi:hypothetical protein